MPRFDLPANSTFRQFSAVIAEYIEPFEQIWPFFWLKAAAVRDGETWHLCQFDLVGRWSDVAPIRQVRDRGDALAAVSHVIDAGRAREMLHAIAERGQLSLLPDVTAQVPDITLTETSYHWQESVDFIAEEVKDVLEPALWVYFYRGFGPLQWLSDYQAEARIRSAVQVDLEQRGMRDFAQYIANRFTQERMSANQFGLTQFNCTIELPLALRVERAKLDQHAGRLELSIQCRRPLRVQDLKATLGKHWASDAEHVPVAVDVDAETGWSFATVTVPSACGGICITEPQLSKWLSYEIPFPSPERQSLDAAYFMYTKSADEPLTAGAERWRDDLTTPLEPKGQVTEETLNKSGARFEIALANALTRLGIPVLFGGQIERGGQLGGHATPGIDLVALDLKSRRATAISLKAKPDAPSDKEIQDLLDAADGLAKALHSWTTFGILACRASANRLGRHQSRTDVRIWSKEDVAFISQADSVEAVRYLLWLPPWVKLADSWAYFSGHVGLVNNPYFRPV